VLALIVAVAVGAYLVYLLEILKWRGTPVIDIVRRRRDPTPASHR